MIKNWYFWMITACVIMIVGAIMNLFTEWPYLAYIGIGLLFVIVVLWSVLGLINWIKNKR